MDLKLNNPIIFFDIESTGVSVGQDKIVEICLLKVHPNQKEEVKTYLINPEREIPKEVIEIHGITNEDVKDKPNFKTLAPEINAFIGNSDMAGYNSNRFDVPLLVEEFLKVGIDFNISNRNFVDVQNIFHKMEPRTLKGAYKFYCNKELINAHSAEADTRATYEVLKAQLDKYSDKEFTTKEGEVIKPIVNNMKSLHNFTKNMAWVDLVGHIVYNNDKQECFNFGKHKGKPVEEVFKNDISYYGWMMNADFPMSTKKIITEIKLRGFNK